MRKIFFIIVLHILIFQTLQAKDKNLQKKKEAVLEALKSGANYEMNVILDKNGRSRCDYNMTEGKWYNYEAPWHTGQAIYALVETYKITKDKNYLNAAKKAGDWWTSLQIKDGSKLDGMVRAKHGDIAGEVIVFATVSDGTAGLFKLYNLTKEKRYADVPTKAGEWMLNNMYIKDARMFYDNVDPKTGEVITESSPFWPNKKKLTLNDVARPNNEGSLYLDLYRYTGDEKYKKVFIDVCDCLVETQGPEGLWMDFMPNHKADGSFHPRFNLWYAESLLDGYELTGDKRYLLAAKKTAQMFAKVQKKRGTIYYKNYLDGRENRNSLCGSAVAFSGIVWLRLLKYGEGDMFKKNIEKSLNWLLKNRFADDHPDPNLAGAFINIRTRHKKEKIWMTNRDIGTSFALRFLSDYYNYYLK
jgi:rhamnogalacturonyl hydrolase YesR